VTALEELFTLFSFGWSLAMKFLFIMTVAVLLPFHLATVVWANPTEIEPAPSSEPNPAPDLESTEASSIEPVRVGQDSELVSPAERSDQLSAQAQQINSHLGTSGNPNQKIRELLNLPDGMIIRGSSRGGLGIGAEY
jgi:hypothetical protein